MLKRIVIGILVGIIAGILDIIPMIFQKLPLEANLSAFSLWVVVGIMPATSNLQIHAVLKGIIIAFLCLLPSVFIIGWNDPFFLLPIIIMTLILGGSAGFIFHKLMKE